MKSASTTGPGAELHSFVRRLYPMHRAITGQGVRDTFAEIAKLIPLEVHEVPTGTKVLDWEVPQEWSIRDAYIADAAGGERLIDYAQSNLHIVNYSQPVAETLDWDQLEPKLFTVPDHPDWIPYRTTYFRDDWGFCVSEHQKQRLRESGIDQFRVVIDSSLFDGSLSYAESTIAGQSDQTVLFYAHTCHPSLANDNLSGIAVATFLARTLSQRKLRFNYRIVFAPATIGAITWLSRNEAACERIVHGLVLTLLGDRGQFTYKRSQRETADIDRIVSHLLSADERGTVRPFSPIGYDERQFCSPGFDLPLGCLMRTPHGEFDQYHTSADDLELIAADSLEESLNLCCAIVDVIERNTRPQSLRPKAEPQLGRYGIYRAYGERDDRGNLQQAVMWVLNQANGERDLLAIAERSGLPFSVVRLASELLAEHGLIQ
jgi:aminopeptidase-like protein